nr:putative reverse transcriptase domain-containing protein [Tanacetum cinerariifolium]
MVSEPDIREEFRTSSGSLDSGGNPPLVTIHTWLERFNKQKPRSFEKATVPWTRRIGFLTWRRSLMSWVERLKRKAVAGMEEEQAKNLQWGLRMSTLNHLMCMPFTDVAQVEERVIKGPEMIMVTNEKVAVAKEKLKEARTRQKSYADKHRRSLEFQLGDHVFLKVSPTRGVRRFGIKGKLSPRFIGPFEILDPVGEVSYRLALPPQFSHVHNDQVGERVIEGPEMIEVTNAKVVVAKEKLKEARTRQKSYADKHRRSLEFQLGDHVFLKVSPAHGVRRFGIKVKLSPRFIGPLEILDRVGEVSYRLALPPQLSHVHNVFHVSLLIGYKYHPFHVISYPLDQICTDLAYVEEPQAILDRQDRVMRRKTIPFIKIH